MKVSELYKRSDCEVSLAVLRKRIAAGEPYTTARRLRNFSVRGRKYSSLWELSKSLSGALTYQQLRYRVGTLKMTPEEAVDHILTWVEFRRGNGTPYKVPREQVVHPDVIANRYKPTTGK